MDTTHFVFDTNAMIQHGEDEDVDVLQSRGSLSSSSMCCCQENHHLHLRCVASERIIIFIFDVLQPRKSSSSSSMCCNRENHHLRLHLQCVTTKRIIIFIFNVLHPWESSSSSLMCCSTRTIIFIFNLLQPRSRTNKKVGHGGNQTKIHACMGPSRNSGKKSQSQVMCKKIYYKIKKRKEKKFFKKI